MLVQIITENGQKKVIPLTADAGAGNPVGTIIVVCSNQIPSNYLLLGTQYDTSLYPVLYALLGTDTTPTASALGLPTLTSGQYAIKATSGLSENAQDNVVAQLNEERSYSTSEVNTGKKWIDGKPIYRKTIDCGALPNATSKAVAHNITNVDFVVSMQGVASIPGGNKIPLPFVDTTTFPNEVQMYTTSNDVVLRAQGNRSNYTNTYVTIEYTKTTD